MPDFWASCGYRLLDRSDDGRLRVTDDYLRAYYTRPELAPVSDSCAAERRLHASLLDEPRRPVAETNIDAIADEDTRENYRIVLRFRDKLLKAASLEAFYVDLFRKDVAIPPAFVHHTAQVILRSILDDGTNGLEVRAAEVFFRDQNVSVQNGVVFLADAETVSRGSAHEGLGNIGKLLREVQAPVRAVDLDVLDEKNHALYFGRDERHDLVLSVNPGQPGSRALASVLERWIAHFHRVETRIEPVRAIPDEEWVWHVGLDAEATAVLNAIYNREEVAEEEMKRVIGLFRAEFTDPAALRPELKGAPVFFALAMTHRGTLRMKPQNLITNLPLAERT